MKSSFNENKWRMFASCVIYEPHSRFKGRLKLCMSALSRYEFNVTKIWPNKSYLN